MRSQVNGARASASGARAFKAPRRDEKKTVDDDVARSIFAS
jgi:hypothetical protein